MVALSKTIQRRLNYFHRIKFKLSSLALQQHEARQRPIMSSLILSPVMQRSLEKGDEGIPAL
jgi:hypothetical protein